MIRTTKTDLLFSTVLHLPDPHGSLGAYPRALSAGLQLSSAAAAAEASAQLDADEPAPTTPTLGKHKRITARAPPRSSARTITQRNVFTHHDSDSDHPPPPFTSTPASPRAAQLPSSAPTSTTPSRRLRHCDDPLPSTPGTTNANHSSMPPPSSSHRPNPRSTPGSNH
ncbi:hypothetical protein BCR44DRAFT_1437184, partial [Catenaria anguillulae PL171]